DEERLLVLKEWNATARPIPPRCIHDLFDDRTREFPLRVAVSHKGDERTYNELRERSNQLAHYLREHGVGPETRVGICVHRSIDSVTAVLAVLKAGGAYVALDPTYPRERLAFILRDARVELVVTHSSLRGALPDTEITRIELDGDAGAVIAERPTTAPRSEARP